MHTCSSFAAVSQLFRLLSSFVFSLSNYSFRCTNGDFYVALGSSVSLALLVWVGGGLLKLFLFFFGNEPRLGQQSPILHLPPIILVEQ